MGEENKMPGSAEIPGPVETMLVGVVQMQHAAIDMLFAMLVAQSPHDKTFYPSKSGMPWLACQMGHAVIEAYEPFTVKK